MEGEVHFMYQFGWIAIAMLSAAIFGALAKRFGQPRVLGALIAGLVIGILGTRTEFMQELRSEHGMDFIVGLSEIGACILLFRAGLEGNLLSIWNDAKVGWRVAVIGIVVPVIGGSLFTYYVFDAPGPVAFFQGGVFAATSVGITAAVLTELGVISKSYGKIIISAAVIDDILGLFILTFATSLNASGEFAVAELAQELGWAVAFVGIVPFLGHRYAGIILRSLNRLDSKAHGAIVFGFMFLYVFGATWVGLAAIVGAYFAGVALDEMYFVPEGEQHNHEVERRIEQASDLFGPIFFVYAGCVINPSVFTNLTVLGTGIAFTVIAFLGKLACGFAARRGERFIVGIGMSPRGEVGIIFATIGLNQGILTQELFGASMIMVLLTTMVTPPLLNAAIPQADRIPA